MAPPNERELLEFFKAMADENRLALIALLHRREYNVGQLAENLQLTEPTVSHHLAKLRQVGLVNLKAVGNQRRYRLNEEVLDRFKHMVGAVEKVHRQPASQAVDTQWLDELPLDRADKQVLKNYTENRRLQQIPPKTKKLLPVLRWIALAFGADVLYSERQVNSIIKQYHDDHTRLRRELVDFGFLRRERGGGKYWLTPEDESA